MAHDGGEERLAESEARTRAILDDVVDGIVTIDASGRIELFNRAAEGIFGWTAAEVAGRDVGMLMPEPWRSEHGSYLRRYLEGGEAHVIGVGREVVGLRRDGTTFPLDLAVSETASAGRRSFTGILRNVTARREAERRQRAHHETTRVLAESGSLAEAAPALLPVIGLALESDMCVLWRRDPDDDILRAVEVWQSPALPPLALAAATRNACFARGRGLPGRVWESGEPGSIPDVTSDPNFPRVEAARESGIRAGYAFPLRFGAELLGVIELFRRHSQPLDEEVVRLMRGIASQVGQFAMRRRAESERDRFFRLSLDMLCIAGFDGYYKQVNPAFERVLGWTPQELLARPLLDLVLPADRARSLEEVQSLAQGGNTVNFENRVLCKDGSFRWLLWNATPFSEERLIYAVGRDITERKRIEDELRASEARLLAVLDNAPAVIYLKDAVGRYAFVNREFETLFGIGRDALRGRTDHDVFPAAIADAFRANDRRVMDSGRPLEVEEIAPHGDGPHVYLSVKFPLLGVGGSAVYLCGISTDITPRKRAEEDLEAAKAAAEEASRAKSRFLANMSHELRTPLNSVIGFANVLLRNRARNLGDQDLVYLERIADNGKHLLQLINDILDLSKVEAGKASVEVGAVDLVALVRDTLAQFETQVRERDLTLVAELPPRMAPLATDAGKLRQVLVNLVGNAVKFTEKGGVRVVVEVEPGGNRPVALEVHDTGIGIPLDRLTRIFEAFEQADGGTERRFGGTGLGLTISRSLLELMGDTLEVESEVGRGSTFRIRFGGAGGGAVSSGLVS